VSLLLEVDAVIIPILKRLWRKRKITGNFMKNTIIMWTMMVLLSLLTACGGSDSSSDSNFSKTDADTETDTETTGDDKEVEEPDTVVEDNVLVALGVGSGSAFQAGVARTGVSTNESLSASGSTTVSVDLVDLNDNNAQFLGLREVSFVSTCSSAGLAEFTPATIKTSGTATVTYKDLGCGKELGATDNVVIYIASETDNPNATARTSIDVEAAEIGAIQFLTAQPSLIALSGFGAADVPSLSKLTFQVVDQSGNPMPDRTVNFVLDYEYGGAELSLDKAITGSDGSVDVILNAGSAAGTIRAKASIDIKNAAGDITKTITTMSVPITMATSLGDQNSFSLSADSFNPHAWDYDGSTVSFNVRLGDHYQNPVIDGTRVYFRATGGLIMPSCETVAGKCSVNWESSNPRPVDGYVTVVAYTRGQGDFQDDNSNGLFDLGESFTAYGESYVDANGNGTYETNGDYQPIVDIDGDGINEFGWASDAYAVYVDSTGTPTYTKDSSNFFEEMIDSNNNGVLDETPAVKYQGVNCSDAAIAAGHCAEQINLVGSVRLQMSQGNSAYIEGPFAWDSVLGRYDTSQTLTCVDGSQSSQKVAWRVADSVSRRNNLPNGSTIELTLDDVEATSSSGVGSVASISPANIWPVWNANSDATQIALGNAVLSAEEKKYYYLNTRGHLVEAALIRAESFTTVTFLGSAAVKVKTVNGVEISAGSIDVDLRGQVAALSKNGVPQASVDISSGTETYTVTLKNQCLQGLPVGAELLIGVANGTLNSAIGSAGAGGAVVSDASTATITITDSTQPAVVNLTISPDTTTGSVANALTVAYSFDDNGNEKTINLNDFIIKD
jgi:hypothetical protein